MWVADAARIPALLWLWRRPVATAPIQPLAWEPPYAAGAAQEIATTTTKRQKTKKKKKEKRKENASAAKILISSMIEMVIDIADYIDKVCLLYTSPSPRDRQKSRMPSSA